jgi:hypothetical protein
MPPGQGIAAEPSSFRSLNSQAQHEATIPAERLWRQPQSAALSDIFDRDSIITLRTCGCTTTSKPQGWCYI